MANRLTGLQKLIDVVAAIRDPKSGCPWDLEQTHLSLMKYFFEEVHEFSESLGTHGPQDPRSWEELGDCLLQVTLHARLFEEKGYSSLDEVANILAAKLVRRHPHVFDPTFERFKSADEVNANWEKIKAWDKAKRAELDQKNTGSQPGSPRGLNAASPSTESAGTQAAPATDASSRYKLEVPSSLPSLLRSLRLGEKASNYGFDWKNAVDIFPKLKEEIAELEEAAEHNLPSEAEELGDLLFACAQYARKKKWDPEQILQKANEKFRNRFEKLGFYVASKNLRMEDLDLETLENMWQELKKTQLSSRG